MSTHDDCIVHQLEAAAARDAMIHADPQPGPFRVGGIPVDEEPPSRGEADQLAARAERT